MGLKKYRKKFEDLFDSKQQAVTSYLSLERRYHQVCKTCKEQQDVLDKLPDNHPVFTVHSNRGITTTNLLYDI